MKLEMKIEDVPVMISGNIIFTRQLYYENAPENDLPVLVFLHDALGCSDTWKDFPEQLCKATGLQGLIYDRVGHGQSSAIVEKRKKDYLHIEALNILPKLLEKLNIDRVILVGHSDGGSIALLFAAKFQEETVAVISEAGHVYVENTTIEGVQKAVQRYKNDAEWRNRLMEYHGDNTDTLFEVWSEMWLSSGFSDWNIEEDISRIACPVLIIQGADDEYATTTQVTAIAENIGHNTQELIIPRCGHAPHAQAAERTLQAMQKFIKNVIA